MRTSMELDFMEDFKSYINKYSLPMALCGVITNTTFSYTKVITHS